MARRLWAGVARANITPPVGILHLNWGAQAHEGAEGVDMDLWATVLVVSDGEETAAIIDLDLGVLERGPSNQLRQLVADRTGIPASHVRVSVAHTHAGPSLRTYASYGKKGAELVPAYMENLFHQVAGAAAAARAGLEPARLAAGSGAAHIGINRRYRNPEGRLVIGYNPDGFFDPEVKVLRLDRADDGRPLATVVHYSCHPIILAHPNRLLSPDYPGTTRRVVEQVTGSTCLFLQGACGEIGPTEGLTGDVHVARRLGTILGLEAAKVWTGLDTRPVRRRYDHTIESGAPLGIWAEEQCPEADVAVRLISRDIALPLRPLPDGEAARREAQHWNAESARLRAAGADPVELRAATYRAKRAGMAAAQAAWHREGGGKIELQALRIGPVALTAIPAEPFAETAAAVKAAAPFAHTLFSGYSNGWLGYIPTPQAYDEGGYEVEIASLFDREAATVLVAETLATLRELARL